MPLELIDLNLKLDRAARLWAEIIDPNGAGPLEYRVVVRGVSEGDVTRWFVDRTETVKPMLAAVLGDLIHNYRSCLGHAEAAIRRAEGLPDSQSSS